MQNLAELLSQKRKGKNITLSKISEELRIKEEILEAFENGRWEDLPEPAISKGFLKNYVEYLGLDIQLALALFRRDFDEKKYIRKKSPLEAKKGLMLTPNKIMAGVFVTVVVVFALYLIVQYFSVAAKPKLQVFTPPEDLTTSTSVVEVTGTTEKGATISIDGEFVAVDENGNFTKEIKLKDGKNQIIIIATKKLSPQNKITKIVRFKN